MVAEKPCPNLKVITHCSDDGGSASFLICSSPTWYSFIGASSALAVFGQVSSGVHFVACFVGWYRFGHLGICVTTSAQRILTLFNPSQIVWELGGILIKDQIGPEVEGLVGLRVRPATSSRGLH